MYSHPAPRGHIAKAGKRSKIAQKRNLYAYLFLAPWFVGLFVLVAWPLLSSLYYSFTNFDLLTPERWVGADNYARMLDDDRYFQALSVTTRYVVVSVPISLAFSLLVAVLLNRNIAGAPFYRSVYYLPSLLGGSVAVAVLWRQIFGRIGLVNQALDIFGLTGPSWISSPDHALNTLIVLHIWQFGSSMIIFLAALRQVPTDLYEAASLDGASTVRKFVHVTIPMLTPVIFFNLVLGMINSFKAFTPAYIVSGGTGGPLDSTLFYTLYLYEKAFTSFQMGYASAMAWVLLVIIAVATGITFVTAKYWVHYSD